MNRGKYRNISISLLVLLIMLGGTPVADRLPQGVPENQRISVYTVIETIGVVMQKTSLSWQVSDGGLDTLGMPTINGNSVKGSSIAYGAYSDFVMTNGGEYSEVKSVVVTTDPQAPGMYNIETQKVLTYESINGSHLMADESYVLDVAGQWSYEGNELRCVFSQGGSSVIPAFCNKATASSKMRSVTSAQVETRGSLTAVGSSVDVPAALNYEISVTPSSKSASGYADGIFSTTFTVSVMEGRSATATSAQDAMGKMMGIYNETSSTLTAIDTASVAGGVSAFNKVFSYQSGIACTDC
ncbi:MAG: hypothetical protein LBV40_04030 [Methanomicrobiales archaeon]|nr:hypothetical protein [Methanomicrobiales archaeon]